MRGDYDTEVVARLRSSLATRRHTSGLTHNFYHYPARFPPDVARAVIETFSDPGDWILDPFMGGGTAVVEGLATGRRVIGVDINALAHFVTAVRTTPLSIADEKEILAWSVCAAEKLAASDVSWVERPQIDNLPNAVETFIAGAVALSEGLGVLRRRAFARCALLRLGQWALDCRDFEAPRRKRLGQQLPVIVRSMLDGLRAFETACADAEVGKKEITGRRVLMHRSAIGIETLPQIRRLGAKPRLVFTSPPYPGVHVLYHRWQYRGRKETSAPYWIASVPDGYGASFYTCGSRTPTGLRTYFTTITAAFSSVRSVIAPNATVVQLVGFSDIATQLPLYLGAMEAAGFEEHIVADRERLCREVPNRKWYAQLLGAVDASYEVLLIHRPRSH